MNLRNKYLVGTVRTLFGLFFIYSGVAPFIAGPESLQGLPEIMINALSALQENGLFYMIKITEIVAGLMLVLRIFPQLAIIFLAPVAVGVIIFNAMIAPSFVITGVIVSLIEIYFGYVYWDKYKALFQKP